jgi:hypothetical protein
MKGNLNRTKDTEEALIFKITLVGIKGSLTMTSSKEKEPKFFIIKLLIRDIF